MANAQSAVLAASVALAALAVPVLGQNSAQFPADQVKKGSDIYARNCAPCHGPPTLNPRGPLDLGKFPPDQKSGFVTSVAKGKNQMPPFGGLFNTEEIEALWAYVIGGETR